MRFYCYLKYEKQSNLLGNTKKKKIGKIKSLGSKIKFNRYPTPIEFHKLRPNKQNLFLPL